MTLRLNLIAAAAVALIGAGPAFASGNDKVLVIKGKVIEDGKPIDGAEIRVKALDRQVPDKVVESDSHGKFIVLGLLAGNYSVTAYDPDGFARSRALIKTTQKGWASVNFDLGLDRDVGNDASRINGHGFFTQPNSHGSAMSAIQ
jgi:Carboxypeptidase regulatory-like domain